MTQRTERLPPGQARTTKFPVLTYGPVPSFNEKTWDFEVYGLVERPLKLSWKEFLALPKIESVSDIHCVTGWSRFDNKWGGVAFKTIVGMTKPTTEARCVTVECDGGYTTSLTLEELDSDDALLAYEHDGGPLPREHGGPLRLVVPSKYFWKSAKWLRKLRFTREKKLGFWEIRGYSDSADPWTEDRYSY